MSGTPKMLTLIAGLTCFWCVFLSADAESRLPPTPNNVSSEAKDKFFSIFTIVQFEASACTTTDNLNGTCYASAVCTERGGTSKGTCASGFGVCCFFTLSTCGSTVSQNCTFIRNPGYPSTYTTAGTCMYFISKCNCDICQIRLDFEAFTIANPSAVAATAGQCLTTADRFTVTTPTGQVLPTLCGINAGHHLYIDAGNVCSDTVSFSFALTGTTVARTWSIKVSQIPCNTNYKADEGCIQQYYGVSGQIRSFNFLNPTSQELAPNDVLICVRMEVGYCGITWSVSPDPNSFQVSTVNGNRGVANCAVANPRVFIPNSNSNNAMGTTYDIYCGMALTDAANGMNAPITSYNKPFSIRHLTTSLAAALAQRGFCLNYRQVPCTASG